MLLQVNIMNTFFNQKSRRHPEVGVSLRHKHTDGHGDFMTDPAQRAKSVKIAKSLKPPTNLLLAMTFICLWYWNLHCLHKYFFFQEIHKKLLWREDFPSLRGIGVEALHCFGELPQPSIHSKARNRCSLWLIPAVPLHAVPLCPLTVTTALHWRKLI